MSDVSAGAYGWSPGVQRKVVALCLRDPQAWGQLGAAVFDAKLVAHPPLRIVAEELYRACASGAPPSPEMLEELARERLTRVKPAMAGAVRGELALVLSETLPDAKLVRQKAAEWARIQAVTAATLWAAEQIERGVVQNGGGGEILRRFQDALAVGKRSQAVMRLVGDPKGVERELTAKLERRQTGIPLLDQAMDGGAEIGMHVVAGDPKLGKTAFLTQVAAGTARRGGVAWYVTAEVGMRAMILRLVRAMTGRSKVEVLKDPRGAVRAVMAYRQARGEVLIEYAPGFTVAWMASRLRQIESTGLRVDVVVADYVDLMGAEKAYGERRFELAHTCRVLRDLAVEAGVRLWAGKSVNRAAVSKTVVTKKDLAECFDVAYIADNIFALCATDEERRRTAVVDGQTVRAPVIRVYYAAGREVQDEYEIGAFERDNDRQRWREIPGYLSRRGEGGDGGRREEGAG